MDRGTLERALDRLVRLAAVARASTAWDPHSSVTLDVSADGYELMLEAEDLDDELPRITGTDLVDVLDRGIERARAIPGAAEPSVTGDWGDPSALGELLERVVTAFGPGGLSLGYIPRSLVVGGECWEVFATGGPLVGVWMHETLAGVLAAVLDDA